MTVATTPRIDWQSVLVRAAQIVNEYDSGVTLRQLFYRLVSEHLIPNKQTTYNSLSSKTAAARRDGWFPSLVDRGRDIQRYRSFDDPHAAIRWLSRIYRLDRARDQDHTVFIGVEKNGLLNLLLNWFGDFGVPIIALGGYSSQTFCDDVYADVTAQGRPAIFIYGGDFDPSGEDIQRDFLERTPCFDEVVRIALTPEQIEEYDLPPLPGKASDSRAQGFIDRHGELLQVELDALPPDVLQSLYTDELMRWFDMEKYEALVALEERQTTALEAVSVEWEEEQDDGE